MSLNASEIPSILPGNELSHTTTVAANDALLLVQQLYQAGILNDATHYSEFFALYNEMQTFINSTEDLIDKTQKKQFEQLVNRFHLWLDSLQINEPKLVRVMASDSQDYFTLMILYALQKNHLKTPTLLSPSSTNHLMGKNSSSNTKMWRWLQISNLFAPRILINLQTNYKNNTLLFDYTIDLGQNITIYSHIATSPIMIQQIARQLDVVYHDKTAEELAATLDKINSQFQSLSRGDKAIKQLLGSEQIKNMDAMSAVERKNFPLAAQLYALSPPVSKQMHRGYEINYVIADAIQQEPLFTTNRALKKRHHDLNAISIEFANNATRSSQIGWISGGITLILGLIVGVALVFAGGLAPLGIQLLPKLLFIGACGAAPGLIAGGIGWTVAHYNPPLPLATIDENASKNDAIIVPEKPAPSILQQIQQTVGIPASPKQITKKLGITTRPDEMPKVDSHLNSSQAHSLASKTEPLSPPSTNPAELNLGRSLNQAYKATGETLTQFATRSKNVLAQASSYVPQLPKLTRTGKLPFFNTTNPPSEDKTPQQDKTEHKHD